MKKGLLSLLAVALTVVSCQNYDDQFAELTGLVNSLSNEVAGFSEVQNSISTLSQTVTGLKSAIEADFTGIEGDIEALELLLADVASEGDLDAITDALALVQADVKELLQADAVINQNITINNAATLEYVSSLISSGPDDPSVIVNGSVTIATALLTPAEVASTSLIVAKLRTVLNAVSITATQSLDLSNLAFIDNNLTITGGKQNISGLRTISDNFSIDYGKLAETLDLTDLTSVGGDITIATTTANSATAVDFGILDVVGSVQTGASGVNDFPNALTIDTSNASYIEMNAAKATQIVSSMEGPAATMTIAAGNGGTIDMNSLVKVTGAFELTGAATTVAHFDGLTHSGALTVNSAGEAHFGVLANISTVDAAATTALNFNGVTGTNGTFSATAPVLLVSSLASITHITTLGTPNLAASSIVSVTAALTAGTGPIDISNAHFATTGSLSTTATKVTIGGSRSAIFANILGATIDDLTVTDQRIAVTAITNTVLDKLHVATADGGALAFAHTAANECTELTVSGFDTVTIGVDGTPTNLVTVTTAGTIKSFTAVDNEDLKSLDIGHTYSSVYTDAQLISIKDHDELTSVDLSTVVRLENASITGNAKLATITAPATTDLLTVGASLSYTINSNAVSVTYTDAVAAVQDGISDTPYVQAKIANASLATWKDYLVAVSAVNSIVGTYAISYDSDGTGPTPWTSATDNLFEDHAAADTENIYSFSIFLADGITPGDGTRLTDPKTGLENLLTWTGSIDTLAELSACE